MAFDRDAHLSAGRANVRASVAAMGSERTPLTLSAVVYLLARHMDELDRLEANLVLAREWGEELMRIKKRLLADDATRS